MKRGRAVPPRRGWQNPISPTGYGHRPTSAPHGQVQTLRMIPVVTCDPAPFEVTVDHDVTLIWSGTVNGPALQCGDIVNDAFESVATIALRIGADGLYSVRLNTAVDNGWMYVTATATAALPRRPAPGTNNLPEGGW
jgi:hypothetical protein